MSFDRQRWRSKDPFMGMFAFIKVKGESLSPDYQDGDYILALRLPVRLGPLHLPPQLQPNLRPGDIITFRHPKLGLLIKRIDHLGPGQDELFVLGTHPHSTDSRHFGPVSRQAVTGKVVWHLTRPAETSK